MIFYNEIIKSIQNVFESSFSTKAISDETKIAYTTVSELRNNKRDIFSTSVENCSSLYSFAIRHNLNQKFLDMEKRKGTYDTISVDLEIERLVVAFKMLDLFALGYLDINTLCNESEKDKLTTIYVSNGVFVTKNKKCYDTGEFRKLFNCNYGGTGPCALVDFIKTYSKIDENEIQKIVFNNEIVMYDFRSDKIEGSNLDIDTKGIGINIYNFKPIITLDEVDNDEVDYYCEKIGIITSIFDQQYNKDTKLKRISYIHHYNNDTQKYTTSKGIRGVKYRVILEFEDFEIWIPYFIASNNVFDTEEMKEFIQRLGIEKREPGFLESISKKLNKVNPQKEFLDIEYLN